MNNDKNVLENRFDSIYPVGSRSGILYGLPKVHEAIINNTSKLQHILSTDDFLVFNLANFLMPILTQLSRNAILVLLKKLPKYFGDKLVMTSLLRL